MNHQAKQFHALLQEIDFWGAVRVCAADQTVFEGAYGYADYERGVPNEPDTTFFIASLTKQFTAAAVMLLAESGKLCLDDTLDRCGLALPYASRVRVRNLLNMNSGLPDYLNDVISNRYAEEEKRSALSKEDFFYYATDGMNRPYSFSDVMELIGDSPLLFAPGSRLGYSNTNYHILGHIIEQISGMSYAAYVAQHILRPLGMTSTHANPQSSDAQSYNMELDNTRRLMGRSRSCGADGCLVTNVGDLSTWLDAALHRKLLHKTSWEQCFSVVPSRTAEDMLPNYGFGWIRDGDWFLHGGRLLGYLAGAAIRPRDHMRVVTLSNKCADTDQKEPLRMIMELL
jgi:CubicO group peptidase (beta-lactamase class C family)